MSRREKTSQICKVNTLNYAAPRILSISKGFSLGPSTFPTWKCCDISILAFIHASRRDQPLHKIHFDPEWGSFSPTQPTSFDPISYPTSSPHSQRRKEEVGQRRGGPSSLFLPSWRSTNESCAAGKDNSARESPCRLWSGRWNGDGRESETRGRDQRIRAEWTDCLI